jgi:hypothetical protein
MIHLNNEIILILCYIKSFGSPLYSTLLHVKGFNLAKTETGKTLNLSDSFRWPKIIHLNNSIILIVDYIKNFGLPL